ncbi:protein-tyrosine phosphatase [Thermomonospora echinospora]|uniref:Protein-tyrosine phosphatase n=1 Tax=Thermomonospora echinospora TaxID=1992 RepID=A0A1H5V543_9ACTN|nr:tyrosine-protein phosphatase [Thermomonospora echinospora]SEF82429.1 protein-tyrosine phosphatase [Thermomonospora echinospora]
MEREIVLEGCVNFRDVGGYRAEGGHVRWRTLFRSDALHELTPEDAARLADLGVTTVIDLRSEYEREHDGEGAHPLAGAVSFVRAPIINQGNLTVMADTSLSLAGRYARILETCGTALADAVTAIAHAPGAVVFHCAAGKDRTGMLSAAVLGALGVDDEDIIADYAMTGRNLQRIGTRLRRHPAYENSYAYVPRDAMTAQGDTMRELLGDLRSRHGDLRGLLGAVGVGEDVLDRLRASLVTS